MLDKNFFCFDTDIYLCFPEYSSCYIDQNIDFLELVENEILAYKSKGSVIILGDFNARTGLELDFISDDDGSGLPLNEDYVIGEKT